MTTGRPKQFDEKQALGAAMEVFWRQGFENTSCDDLMVAMDIRPGSMYSTFGDKETLYAKALGHYQQEVMSGAIECLEGPGSPLENLRNLIGSWGDFMSDPACKGCLVSNTLVEFGNGTSEIAQRARMMLDGMRAAFRLKLEAAQELGELSEDANPEELAAFLVTTAQGLSVMARSGADEATIRGVVNTALRLLE